MRKNPHGRILREELKKQYLNTVPKSCPKDTSDLPSTTTTTTTTTTTNLYYYYYY